MRRTLLGLTTLTITVAMSLGITRSADAQLIAYEGFDYADGAALGNGGFGWSGGWSTGTFVAHDNAGTFPMTYPGIPSTGNRALYTGGGYNTAAQRTLDVSGAFSAYAEMNGDGDMVIGKDGTSIWTSFLLQGAGPGSASQGNWVSFRDDFLNNFQGDVNIGRTNGVPNSTHNATKDIAVWQRVSGATGLIDNPGGAFAQDGEAQLIVAEFIFGAGNNDTINLYIDEDATGDPNDYVLDASITGFDMGFYALYLNRAGTNGDVFGWDEFRFGATANDVLPNSISAAVPEPASVAIWSLLGVVGAGIFLARRKRR